MRLHREAPVWMGEAVRDRRLGMGLALGPIHRLQQKMLEIERLEPRWPRFSCGKTSLSSCPLRTAKGASALGLTQIQSSPSGGTIVPLVSTAISKPCACSAAINGASTCSSGSPPVAPPAGFWPAHPSGGDRPTSCAASPKRPPPVPSTPTKSVSQKRQTASARSPHAPTRGYSPRSGRTPRPAPRCCLPPGG